MSVEGAPAATQTSAAPARVGAAGAFRVEAHRAFDFLHADYRDLWARSGATAFQSPLWLDRIFARLVPRDGGTPLILTARAADGRLVLVLPLVARRRGGLTVLDYAGSDVCDYVALVAAPEIESLLKTEQGDALRAAIARAMPRLAWGRLRNVREDHTILRDLLPRSGVAVMPYRAHACALEPDAEAWRARAMSDKFRRNLDRANAQLRKRGAVRLREATTMGEIEAAFAAMREARGKRFADDVLQDDERFAFFLDMAARGAGEGAARTYALTLDDEIVAVVFGLARGDTFAFTLMGFSDAHRKHSPGLLVVEAVIKDCISRGERTFDMTIGDERYKADFGAAETRLLELWIGNPALIWAARRGREAARAVKRWRAARQAVK